MRTTLSLLLLVLVTFSAASVAAQTSIDVTGLTEDQRAVVERSRAWIEEGFSPGQDTQNYTYERYLEGFYDPTPGNVVLHDNNDPQMRIETDARAYARIWQELFAQTAYLRNEWVELHHVIVDGDLALISFTADALVDPGDGELRRFPVLYSLGWRRTPETWLMIHEHGSNLITEESPVR